MMKCSFVSRPQLSCGFVLILLVSCARSPDSIEAMQVSGDAYQKLSCDALIAKDAAIKEQLARAVDWQQKARNSDIFFTFLIPLWAYGGSPADFNSDYAEPNENYIAELRGEAQSVKKVYDQRGC